MYRSLLKYVIRFDGGGFWYCVDHGLTFVTNGINSDELATYEDAKHFLEYN